MNTAYLNNYFNDDKNLFDTSISTENNKLNNTKDDQSNSNTTCDNSTAENTDKNINQNTLKSNKEDKKKTLIINKVKNCNNAFFFYQNKNENNQDFQKLSEECEYITEEEEKEFKKLESNKKDKFANIIFPKDGEENEYIEEDESISSNMHLNESGSENESNSDDKEEINKQNKKCILNNNNFLGKKKE